MTRTMRFIFLVVVATLLLGSCAKDPSWDVDIHAPVFNTSLGMNDLIADSLLMQNPDSSLTFVFDYDLFSITTDTFVSLPDSLYYAHYAIPIGILAPPGTLVLSKTESKYYDLDGALLTEMRIKSGKLSIRAYNYVGDAAYIEYTLDNSLLNGVPVELTGTIPSYPVTGQHLETEVDVSGMYLDLSQSYMHCNSLKSTLKVYANPDASGPVQINYNDSIDILVEFKDIVIDYTRGYFGQHYISTTGTDDFPYLEDLGLSYLDIENIDMTLTLQNYLGVDASFNLSNISGNGITDVALTSEWIGRTIFLQRASEQPPFSGNVSPSEFEMDFSAANVEAFFENLPSVVSYNLTGVINPMGNVSAGNDFVYYGQGLNGHIHAEVPMKLSLAGLILRDTIPYELHRSDQFLNGCELTLQLENGFPLQAEFALYLLDQNGMVQDSIFPDQMIPSGIVDASDVVTAPSLTTLKILLDAQQTTHLYDCRSVVVQAILATGGAGGQKVTFYPHYTLNMIVTGLFNLHVQ